MRNEVEFHPSVPVDHDLAEAHFDYGSVSLSVAKFLKGQADRIRRQSTTSTIQIGRALLEAKRHLSHGAFINWVKLEIGIPARTAQAYMRVASWAANKGATVAHLSPSALYLLSASSTPSDFVSNIMRRAEAGEYVAPSVMREELKLLRIAEQQEQSRSEMALCRAAAADVVTISAANGLVELVSILLAALSPTDFERVRAIMISECEVGDLSLAQKFERAFETCCRPR